MDTRISWLGLVGFFGGFCGWEPAARLFILSLVLGIWPMFHFVLYVCVYVHTFDIIRVIHLIVVKVSKPGPLETR